MDDELRKIADDVVKQELEVATAYQRLMVESPAHAVLGVENNP